MKIIEIEIYLRHIAKNIYLSVLMADEKRSVRTTNWNLCLSQFRIMYEGRS